MQSRKDGNNSRGTGRPELIKVRASETFGKRRLKTINGLTYKQYRQLQAGRIIEIKKSTYDLEPNLYEVENGNNSI